MLSGGSLLCPWLAVARAGTPRRLPAAFASIWVQSPGAASARALVPNPRDIAIHTSLLVDRTEQHGNMALPPFFGRVQIMYAYVGGQVSPPSIPVIGASPGRPRLLQCSPESP